MSEEGVAKENRMDLPLVPTNGNDKKEKESEVEFTRRPGAFWWWRCQAGTAARACTDVHRKKGGREKFTHNFSLPALSLKIIRNK